MITERQREMFQKRLGLERRENYIFGTVLVLHKNS